jgi:salicylate hydroxylase
MLSPDKPVFTGNVAWRAIVPTDKLGDLAPNLTACAWFGKGRHAVTYRLRGGELVNFVGVVERDDWRKEGWTESGVQEDLVADFAGWYPVIDNIIKRVDAGSLYRWALFDRSPLEKWTDGRTALLGDAAHPMLPFLAQGAAMAVEDAWVICPV